MEIRIRDEFIKLGQALKLADLVSDGVEAKYAINDGLVLVNGEVENRRGRKIHPGDTISYDGKDIYVILNCLGLDAYLGWNTKETDSYLEELERETTDS